MFFIVVFLVGLLSGITIDSVSRENLGAKSVCKSIFSGLFIGLILLLTYFYFEFAWILKVFAAYILINISIVDFKTYKIPLLFNVFLFILGIFSCIDCKENVSDKIQALILVGGAFILLYKFTKGRAIGGGDVKLVVSTSLLLGFERQLWAIFAGLIIACLCYFIFLKKQNSKKILALGPFLSIGIIFMIFK